MPTLIDPVTLRLHVETDLHDPELQRLLDDADDEIVSRYGPHAGDVTEDIDTRGAGLIFPSRPATAITSLTEYTLRTDLAGVLLNPANDYRLLQGGRVIERLQGGANSALSWGQRIVLVYSPTSETARRKRLEIDLVKLALRYDAVVQESIGDYSARDADDYQKERERLIGSLRAGRIGFA